jgi:hypothetical protein
MSDIKITLGHVARHTPPGAGAQGRDAAISDIAQDLLLRHLNVTSILAPLAFKGGTALRKLYAGNAGRFSLDLDFAFTGIGENPDDALTELIAATDGLRIGRSATESPSGVASGRSPTLIRSVARRHCRANWT